MTSSAPPGLTRFNEAAPPHLAGLLHEVCASGAWGAALAAGRPYACLEGLLTASDAAMASLTPADIGEAVAGHPPIGRPTEGDPVSAREQSGVRDGERAELLRLGRAYQRVHGQVFLICATGLGGAEVRAALERRIGNDAATEREIVRAELGRINRIRLTGLVSDLAAVADPHAVPDGGPPAGPNADPNADPNGTPP